MSKVEEMNIYEKLMNIQQELKAPKGQRNSFGNYNYRSCEDILEAVKPLLEKYKCVLTISDELVNIGDRYYIKATATLWDVENKGEELDMQERVRTIDCLKITNIAYARESLEKKGMDESQITGATSSYARKYALNGLFAIDDTKDADTDEYQKQTKSSKENKEEPTFREQLIAYCKEKDLKLEDVAKANNLSKDSTEEDYKKVLVSLKLG